MATSVIEICNNALIKVGADAITSLTEDVKAARICNRMYEIVRDDLLRSHPWNFTITRASLPQLSAAPSFGYDYQFQLPSDCLRVLGVDNIYKEYRVEGRKILSSSATIKLIYIKKEEDPTQYDSSFSNVLALKLASEISFSMSNNATLMNTLSRIFKEEFSKAKRSDAQEDSMKQLTTTTWTDGRFTPPSA